MKIKIKTINIINIIKIIMINSVIKTTRAMIIISS